MHTTFEKKCTICTLKTHEYGLIRFCSFILREFGHYRRSMNLGEEGEETVIFEAYLLDRH